MAEAPAQLSSNLGPGPRAFLAAHPPSGMVGRLPSPEFTQLNQLRQLRLLVSELAKKFTPVQIQEILRQVGIMPPDLSGLTPGDSSPGGGDSGEGAAPSNLSGYDPGLVSLGLNTIGSFAPGPVNLSLAAGAKALTGFSLPGGVKVPGLFGSGNLTTAEGEPASYTGPTSPFGLGKALLGLPFGRGHFANTPAFVTGTDPFSLQGTEFALANAAPQQSLGWGFGPNGEGFGPLGTFGEGRTGSTFSGTPGEFGGGPVGQPGVPAAGNPAGGYGNPLSTNFGARPSAPDPDPTPVNSEVPGIPASDPDGPPSGLPGEVTGIPSSDPDTSGGDGGTGDGGGSTVICTELHRQGLMDEETWAADVWFGLGQAQETLDGYHLWAIPVAKAMRRSKLVTALVAPVALLWAREMAFRMKAKPTGSLVGRALMVVGIPVCTWLGYNRRKGAAKV